MITRTSIIAITLALASTANAWVVPNKAAFEKVAAAGAVSAALFTAPLVSHAAQFDGTYTDAAHPNCVREIQTPSTRSGKALITGTDGNPACKPDGSGGINWNLSAKVKGDEIFVDFTPKGGPKDVKGKFVGDGIQWPDGNKWTIKEPTRDTGISVKNPTSTS